MEVLSCLSKIPITPAKGNFSSFNREISLQTTNSSDRYYQLEIWKFVTDISCATKIQKML